MMLILPVKNNMELLVIDTSSKYIANIVLQITLCFPKMCLLYEDVLVSFYLTWMETTFLKAEN